MRILVVSQHFWPENFRLNDLCSGFRERGHEVTVLTGLPNYPGGELFPGYSFLGKYSETWNGIRIHRALLVTRGKKSRGLRLFVNYLSFVVFGSIRALFLKGSFDLIFVFGSSPVTACIPALVARTRLKAPVFLWIQDLWPYAISASGNIHNKFIFRITNWISKTIHKACDRVLIQSQGFRGLLNKQGVADEKIIYYPNSTESFYYETVPDMQDPRYDLPEGFNVVFAGNIGHSQDFPTIMQAAALVRETNDRINFIILGEGRLKPFVDEQIETLKLHKTVHLMGAFPAEEMPHFFARADALLVTLRDDFLFTITIPSKLQSYLAGGKPIVAAISGENANIISESGAGLTTPAGDAQGLAETICEMSLKSEEERRLMGEKGRSYFLDHFERGKLLQRFEEIAEKYFSGN